MIAGLATYQNSGSGSLVTQTYNQPGIEKTLASGPLAWAAAAIRTPRLNRFGRMIDLRWKKGSTNLVGFEYDFDRGRCMLAIDLIAAAGNRLFERNTISTGSNPDVDSLFGFDQLNRMTDFDSGLLNTGGTAIASPESSQTLELDETGNISRYALASGSATVLDQSRTQITVTKGQIDSKTENQSEANAIELNLELPFNYNSKWINAAGCKLRFTLNQY